METIVKTQDLAKQYNPPNGVRAVDGVSFEIYQGEIFGLLGPNGAGKTTIISMLSCLLQPTGGDAWVAGHSIIQAPMAVKQNIGVVPQEIALYPTLSARQNLVFWGQMYGLGGKALALRVDEVLEQINLQDRASDRIETYSGGMKRRVNIGVGLLHKPKVVYMDEPTVGVDPQSRRNILDMVKDLNRQGMTVLYTTHYMEEASELSERIGIIDHGQFIALGSEQELTRVVGQHDAITLMLASGTISADLTDKIVAMGGVSQVTLDNGCLKLLASSGEEALPKVISILSAAGVRVRSVEIQEPNLEAVFLHLTGRALRD